jgi:hypothetical protein
MRMTSPCSTGRSASTPSRRGWRWSSEAIPATPSPQGAVPARRDRRIVERRGVTLPGPAVDLWEGPS